MKRLAVFFSFLEQEYSFLISWVIRPVHAIPTLIVRERGAGINFNIVFDTDFGRQSHHSFRN